MAERPYLSHYRKYAIELANYAGASVQYIVADFLEWNAKISIEAYDLVYMEGGVLHYFSDLGGLMRKISMLMRIGGTFVLNDFHPIRKFIDEGIGTNGDCFDTIFIQHQLHMNQDSRKKRGVSFLNAG